MLLWLLFVLWAFAEEPPTDGAPPMAVAVDDLPDELRPWVAWVRSQHPELACPLVDGARTCLWPGEFMIDAGPGGAAARLDVRADRGIAVPLPGGRGAWPLDVRVDGAPAPVGDVAGRPMVPVPAGEHRITWTHAWTAMPQALPLPPTIGRIALRVDGADVPYPSVDEGALRLGAGGGSGPAGDQLTLEVSRLVADGVPVRVTTRIALSVAGTPREVDLGDVLVAGTRPVALTADLPARLGEDGALVLQVRPGAFQVTLDALHDGPVTALEAPAMDAPWPEREFWAVAANERVRAVDLSGPPGVDPARTWLPQEWASNPTFRVTPGTPLAFDELRRGEPEPAPNRLELERTLWLDADGRGLTVRDRFRGALAQGWRLDVHPPAVLGHVADHGTDQVITTRDGDVGVETRWAEVDLVAESRIDERPSQLPAVGWRADVTSLSAELNLPPGWRLLFATGVDHVTGIDPWSLFDLFFVLVMALALGRLLGWPWAAVALLALGLARHEVGAPAWTFVFLTVAIGLLRVLPEGWFRTGVSATRWILILVLFSILVPFAVGQIETGLFPVLEQRWNGSGTPGYALGGEVAMEEIPDRFVEVVVPTSRVSQNAPIDGKSFKNDRYLSVQQDPTAVVQTGPGVPSWSWNTVDLRWSGPVNAGHTVGLWLLGPRTLLLLAFLRVGLLLVLALRLSGVERVSWKGLARAAPAALLLLLPLTGRAAPDAALLAELEDRLTVPEACVPHCASAPLVALGVADDVLTVDAEVHALAETAWPLPGPTTAWVPASVTLNGQPHAALARQPDGFLWVRLPPGVHRLTASGPLPVTDALPLQLARPPQRLTWAADAWMLEGLKADGTIEGTVQLVRAARRGAPTTDADNLRPWLEVHRRVDLGLPWRVATTVRRVGPTGAPVALRVPLLPGESVTDETFEVKDGALVVTLDRDRTSVTWLSTLAEAPQVTLTAPTDVPWTEEWRVTCSPMHACTAEDGPPPLAHVQDGVWSPRWRPWPGERVTLGVSRPEGIEGQTVTIDRAQLSWTPGRRLGEGTLALDVRSSQGGRQLVTLPEGAKLLQVLVQGEARPIRLQDERVVALPLQPGAQSFQVDWQQPHAPALVDAVPAVDLGGPAVNTTVDVNAPEGRVVLALFGPRRGPVPLFWVYVVLVVVAAPLLGRLPYSPLAWWQWGLLGIGMTQVPVFLPLLIALTWMALGVRRERTFAQWWAFDLAQLGLIALVLASAVSLYAAIHAGLLLQPDMQVAGNASNDHHFQWFVDRTAGPLATPTVVSAPLWTWRVFMLLWSLWLAASLVRWAPWIWRAWSADGFWRSKPAIEG